MFNSIEGIVTGKEDGALFIKTGGLEWEISVPPRDLDALPQEGQTGRVWTWLSHKENEMRLFGFSSAEGRSVFLELLKVDGIGPKAAQKIMNGISGADLEAAIENDDLRRLEAVPGLGKKTAQKMMLALKGKIVMGAASVREKTPWDDLAQALTQMGYDRKDALAALEEAAPEVAPELTGHERENAIFNKAIWHLST
jgi:Holliday junction DNA helicase RuvA